MVIRSSIWSQPCLRSIRPRDSLTGLTCRRNESSARRLRKSLKVKPHPSFLPSSSNPTGQDYMIFNPPASAPSVYITPNKFLPKSDRRRALYESFAKHVNNNGGAEESRGNEVVTEETVERLPPPLRTPYQKKYHLREEQIAEIKKLRTEDPAKWTREKLAKKYDCSPLFVSIVCRTSPEFQEQQDRVLAAVKSGWGRRRREAREDRARRVATWGYDEG